MDFHSEQTTYVGHVRIKVENLDRSLKFYQDMIGFELLEQTLTTAHLTTDGKTSILSLEQPKNVMPKQNRTTGLYHFALLLPKRSDLAYFVTHLLEKGVHFASSDHLVSEALYLNDPDGNGIEIYADRDPTEWIWTKEEVNMTVDSLDFEDLFKSIERKKVWNGLPVNTKMGHIHLHVSELIKSEQFYVKGLGFDVVNRYGEQALFLSTGKYHHHIALNTWNGIGAPKPDKNSVGLESFTIIYPNEEEIKKAVNNLENIGVKVIVKNGRYMTSDPSGNYIVLSTTA